MPNTATAVASPFSRLDERKSYLDELVRKAKTHQPVKTFSLPASPSSHRSLASAIKFPNGSWYGEGFHPDHKYRVENLVAVYRGFFPQHRPHQEPPPYSWYLRKHLLAWLKECGHVHCENVIEYGVKNWDSIKFEIQVEECEAPPLNVIYGFRYAISRLMEKQGKRTWGATTVDWEKNNAETIEETIFC